MDQIAGIAAVDCLAMFFRVSPHETGDMAAQDIMAKLNVDRTLRRAQTYERNGEMDQARLLYESILEVFPKNVRAQQALAKLTLAKPASGASTHPPEADVTALLELYRGGHHAQLIEQTSALIQRFPNSFVLWNIQGASYRCLNRLKEAEEAFIHASVANPNSADVFKNLGITLIEQGKFADAVSAYEKLIRLKPEYVAAHNNLGLALRELGKLEDALAAFKHALTLKPDYADAYNNIGLTLYLQGKLDDALAAYAQAIDINPHFSLAHYNSGNALKKKGRLKDAVTAFKRAVAINPNYAQALNNMGTTLTAQRHFDAALDALQRASVLDPNSASIQNNIGNVWLEKNDFEAARSAYVKALELRPDYPEGKNNLGVTYYERGQFSPAITYFHEAIALRANFPEAHTNLGNALAKAGKLDEAIAAYKQAITLDPNASKAECAMLHQMQHACDWSGFEHMQSVLPKLGITTEAVTPFSALAMEDHPERQMQRSLAWVQSNYGGLTASAKVRDRPPKDRLHIGYFSADFHNHPCLYLMMGVLRCHDTSRFEVSVFSYGRIKSGHLRERAKATVDHFHDVAEMDNDTLIAFAQSQNLDIAIDLMGHTRDSRIELFQRRLAPVHVGFVGFPGTTGAEFIDYLVGDPTVIPNDHRHAYTERILYMPNTYLPNDNTLPISDKSTSRADFGLPEDAFVFCCFNNNYKISPREFDIWMRVMRQIDNSVLWLLRSNDYSIQNLRKEAQARGVDPERLIFAEKTSHPEHVARQKHADLFVDTFNYNAHTTASEALWAGLPIVTKCGDQFAARVAASMLTSIGLPELITTSEPDYEALILDLATDRTRLRKIKDKLATHRLTWPFFKTEKFTQDFENGLRQAHELWVSGAPPKDIPCERRAS